LPDDKTLATGSDNILNLCDAANSNSVLSVVLSPDGEIIASGSTDQTVKLWRVE